VGWGWGGVGAGGWGGVGWVGLPIFCLSLTLELSSFFVVEFVLFCLVFISTMSIEFTANKKKPNLPITKRLVFSMMFIEFG